jgi:hypothetical protein
MDKLMIGHKVELGLNSFGEIASDGPRMLTDAETVHLLVEEAQLAERVGLDIFSIGEHYRDGHVDSAGPVLSGRHRDGHRAHPPRHGREGPEYQRPGSPLSRVLDSRRRIERSSQLILGRAPATESFPLFGYDIAQYETLFEEKLDLFMKLRRAR